MIKYHFARGNQGLQNPKDFDFVTANVKEQPVQEYLTDSSGILGQINLETLNNVINLRLKRSKFF